MDIIAVEHKDISVKSVKQYLYGNIKKSKNYQSIEIRERYSKEWEQMQLQGYLK